MTWVLTLGPIRPRVGTDSAALRSNAGHRHLIEPLTSRND
jgi:hypothetical protein